MKSGNSNGSMVIHAPTTARREQGMTYYARTRRTLDETSEIWRAKSPTVC